MALFIHGCGHAVQEVRGLNPSRGTIIRARGFSSSQATVTPKMMYEWEGKIEEDSELLLIHQGNAAYLDWLGKTVAEKHSCNLLSLQDPA
ncbi:hypothetical protein LSH36_92g05013 [Paralvinella palmiformis]|uniref:Uncharacterized protein n=1 Tax=Paralvinella palmiformis TaxID=53620 RepID=A0AAD9K0Z6_9ANNE|nr:hypothetical protein LSH36_92g05013 [Paralvinella palmiformis]